MIHLTSSKVSLLALGNEALVLTLLFGQLCKCVFFGRLREAEVEHLYERSWYAITETCLAMTIFREEFNFRFVTLFTALLFLKIFHWLMQDRISYMEQTPAVPLMTHARMLLLMAILFALDSAFLYHAVSISIQQAPSVLLLFAFEHLILASTVCSTFSKYALHINDLRLAGRWDSKGVCMFYLELMTDLFQACCLPLALVFSLLVRFLPSMSNCFLLVSDGRVSGILLPHLHLLWITPSHYARPLSYHSIIPSTRNGFHSLSPRNGRRLLHAACQCSPFLH